MRKTARNIGLLVLIMVYYGCNLDDEVITPEEQLQIELENVDKVQLALDTQIIDTYLQERNITAMVDNSGLRYVIHTQGTGISPELDDFVTVNYRGTLLSDGSEFDANQGVQFRLEQLILGWKVGFKLLQEGTTATLYIPSGLGYSNAGRGSGIPPNANLIFEEDLLDVKRSQ